MDDLRSRLQDGLGSRFLIEREIGSGGMAVVYLARDPRHERAVAIKVLKPERASVVGPQRFLQEVRIAASLAHPHIVPIYDSGEADGLLYCVMRYVEGQSLREKLDREGPLPVAQALAVARDVADGLELAHRREYIHRDIKPSNVLLTERHALIADFGIARAVAAAAEERMTATDATIGTPVYMSPEQAAGERDLDGRSDQYSLGCVIYEMLSGRPPFLGPNADTVRMGHIAGSVRPLAELRPDVPSHVSDAVDRSLSKERSDRFSSVAEFALALGAPIDRTAPQGEQSFFTKLRRRWLSVSRMYQGAVLAATALATFVAVRAVVGLIAVDPRRGPVLGESSTIAVLPLDPLGGDESLEPFARNITQRLIEGLSEYDALNVISWRATSALSNTAPLDSVADILNASLLVDGSLESYNDSVRVRIRLVDGGTLAQIGGNVAEAAFPERLQLVDAVADTVLDLLRQRLGTALEKRNQLLETTSAIAFAQVELASELVQDFEGRLAAADLRGASSALDQADSLLAEAERQDPGWIEPPIARGWLSFDRVKLAFSSGERDVGSILIEGIGHADRALQKDGADPRALELRGNLRLRLWREDRSGSARALTLIRNAEEDLLAASAEHPRRARVFRALGEVYQATHRYESALIHFQRAYDRDPFLQDLHIVILRLFEGALVVGQDQRALRHCREGQVRYPNEAIWYHCQLQLMAWTEAVEPDPDRAWELVDRALVRTQQPLRAQFEPVLNALVAGVLQSAGMSDSAATVLAAVTPETLRQFGVAVPYAGVLTKRGQLDEAVDVLSAVVGDAPALAESLLHRRELWSLRGHPAFAGITGTGDGS